MSVVDELKRVLAEHQGWLAELRIRAEGNGYEVQGPDAGRNPRRLPCDPDVVREAVRYRNDGSYRALSGERSLPKNWSVACASLEEAAIMVETIYPLALHHRAQWRSGSLRVVRLESTMTRHQGVSGAKRREAAAAAVAARASLCARCVRMPVWEGDIPDPLPGDFIPCPEACSPLLEELKR